jgi:hypothetical protein
MRARFRIKLPEMAHATRRASGAAKVPAIIAGGGVE